MAGKKQFSVAYWVKINIATATNWLDVFRWYSTDGSSSYGSRNEFYTDCTRTGFWFAGSPNSISGKATTVGEWHHHAFIIDYSAGTAEFYINGVSVGAVTGVYTTHYLTGENFMIGENGLDASINDVRIYDHCLSPKEVKELSKGLVAHYPLNDGVGNPNLILSDQSHWYLFNASHTLERTNDGVKMTVTSSAPNGFMIPFASDNTLVGDETFTLTFKYKTNISNFNSIYLMCRSGGNKSIWLSSTNYYSLNEWKTFSLTSSFPSTSGQVTYAILIPYIRKVNSWIEIKDNTLKLEKGSVATSWIPNPNDELYSTMGFDDGIVYDCSGYGHDGNIVGSISINSEAPRYTVSSSFSGNEQILAESPTAEAKSASLWIYIPSIETNNLVFADYKSKLAFGFYSSYIVTAVTGDNNYRTTYESSLLTNNSWHHIVIVKSESSGMELWIDGVKQTPRSGYDTWSSGMSDGLTIGARTNGNNKFIGSISDLRIYATALSAEDIKSLYETRASIDNYNNVYAYELMEV